jgi:hypothetical protein
MTRDFIPTHEQLSYFDEDLMRELQRQGIVQEDHYTTINSIDWYNWDDDPRWFVNVATYDDRLDKTGYVEVDVYFDPCQYISVDRVSLAGHGYPCQSTTIAQWNKETDTWDIEKEEE